MQHFDVAIVGGGLVGASLARALNGTGLRIALIDQQPLQNLYSPAMDNRGIALSYTSKKILQDLEVWSAIAPHAYPIQTVHVSEQGSFGFTKLQAKDCNLPVLGYVVSAANLAQALIHELFSVPAVEIFTPAQINELDWQDSKWNFALNSNKISATLLVAADGTNSQLRTKLNIPIFQKDFQQSAMVSNLALQFEHANIAYERFTRHGVLALLPFGPKRMKCILSVQNAKLAELSALNDDEFINLLHAMIGRRIGKIKAIDQRLNFPIQHVQAQHLYTESAVIIGNTANTMHPVAAQGFNLGLRDAMQLGKLLADASVKLQPINSDQLLKKYSQLRSADHQRTQKLTNSLVEIFTPDYGLTKVARRIALTALQFVPSMQSKIIQHGLGICKL